VGELSYSGASSWVAGTVDIDALRRFRSNSRWGNWMKDLTTEQYRVIYEQDVYPKNLYLERKPYDHAGYREEVLEKQILKLQELGIYAPPRDAGD
jgi:hypothetical protein